MLPKPVEIDGYSIAECEDDFHKAWLYTKMLDSLSDVEKRAYNHVCLMLDEKLNRQDREINIEAMLIYLGKIGCELSEILCRRLINKYEWDTTGQVEFKITHGEKKWHQVDAVRATQIEKRK